MDTITDTRPDAWDQARARKGYVVYWDGRPGHWWTTGFPYTITYDGHYLTIATTMREVNRRIRKHRAKRAAEATKKSYYENPIVYTEEA